MIHVIHHNDQDGICAAAIVRMYYNSKPVLVFHEINYNQPAPIEQLKPGDTVWIVDFSFPPEEMEMIVAALAIDQYTAPYPGKVIILPEIIWIDHHKTAAAYGYNYKGLRDFSDKGPAGCELTWRYCFPASLPPAVVRLTGDYDSWRLQIPDSKIFHEGAKIELSHPLSDRWGALLDTQSDSLFLIERIMNSGRIATAYRSSYTGMIRKSYGYPTNVAGRNAYAMNLYGFGSQQFGPIFNNYPLVAAYIHDGEKFTVSLYSRDLDVGEIAKSFGGGGHKGAAGFVCRELPFKPSNDCEE
jgi:oligoribonuclease NrnB/cAMP/cGMP phosphodiesterase (DHH superfamily)